MHFGVQNPKIEFEFQQLKKDFFCFSIRIYLIVKQTYCRVHFFTIHYPRIKVLVLYS